MKKKYLIIIIIFCKQIFPVSDSLITYNAQTGTTSCIAPTVNDTSVVFENTGWDYGSIQGFQSLPLVPPDSTYNESGFTYYMPVQNFYSTSNFPIRTAVKIFLLLIIPLSKNVQG